MSWFDASGLANIAKSALKEVQRTVDKALDIKENDVSAVPDDIPVDTNSEDFFGVWGITESGNIKKPEETTKPDIHSSLWGSFTGSFFDANQEYAKSIPIDSLDDSVDTGNENFSSSKLVVQHSDDGDSRFFGFLSNETVEDTSIKQYNDIDSKMIEVHLESPECADNITVKGRENPSSSLVNRLSVVSSESEKNSLESLKLITYSPECTSPESDVLSTDYSISTSSLGTKQTSESVEVLLDSPSSVEVISSDSGNAKQQDEFASSLESPLEDEEASSCADKTSPDSVEVIPEDQEESVAEDTMSYTSVSESTSATVLDSTFLHLKPQKLLKDTFNTSMTESDVSLSPDRSHSFGDAITRAPGRGGMHLPLVQVNQILIDTQPQSNRQDLAHFLKNTNIIDIPQDESLESQIESNDEGSQSDRTVIARDGGMDSSSDTSITDTGMNSVYLKNLLADAMTEKSSETIRDKEPRHFMDLSKSIVGSSQNSSFVGLDNISITQLDMPPRENSSVSSESRSDLVKIGSDHTSGHTSGDDLETTTSSDIEVISSPNGDSSSTQSRQSPAKQLGSKHKSEDTKVELLCRMTMKKAKGHTRELSEASSISDDSHPSELDRLIKKISEMTEILESRELKLIDMNRRNAELQDLNTDLKHQVDSMLNKQLESVELCQVTEEYTQRLSALEKKFQQAIREKDTLRKQLEQSKQEAATRMSKTELESLLSEKNETIEELREEGEKLSKVQLQHSNIIKKLRMKEKENETSMKHLKETIEGLSIENERLKRSLTAKEEVECSQIEAVHQLTARNRMLEMELAKLQSQFDDLTHKHDTIRQSLDAAKNELIDKNRTSSELVAREHMLESLENEKRVTESQNAAIIEELEDLRLKLRQSELDHVKKEQLLRKESIELVGRLEKAEARNEELSQSVLEVSKPLVRQLESLQATYTIKTSNFEKVEQELTSKIYEFQVRLQAALTSEKLIREECGGLRSKVAEIEFELSKLRHENEMMTIQIEQNCTQKHITEQEFRREINDLKEKLRLEEEKVKEYSKNTLTLQDSLALERTAHEMERNKSVASQEPLINLSRSSPHTSSNSPTLSLGKASIAESMESSFWSQEEPFDVGQAPRYTNMFEMQMLQTNLKQREGEMQQLQWELNRREQERSLLNSEISSLLIRLDDLQSKLSDNANVTNQLAGLQQQYDTLCQLYGEKVEQNEELKLDLQDVKDMYKSQIDELLKQQKHQS